MILRGINFGSVLCSSGAMGFYGDGYWYHTIFKPLGLDYSRCTFVAKTTTLLPRQGNMILKQDGVTPKKLLPDCIKVNWRKGTTLNAVGLSGPGAKTLLDSGKWQQRTQPFFISFMSLGSTEQERLAELNDFIQLLSNYLPQFNINIGLEINFSCPNVDVDYYNLTDEIHQAVSIARKLNIPIIPNLSPDIPTRLALEIALSGCDAISIANTVKFGRASDKIDWKELWGNESPLKHLGGGGISGAPLLPLILKWGRHARNMGLKIPIILGGGIMSADDAKQVIETGASAIKLGVVGMLRPWRVRSIVKAAEALYLSQNSSP